MTAPQHSLEGQPLSFDKPGAGGGAAPGAAGGQGGDRLDQFRAELATMSVATPADGDDRRLLLAGVVLVVAGIAAILAGYVQASGTSNLLDQTPALISGGIFGVALVAIGAALFVRYSMSRYLRYWLIRTIYEQRLQTDRTVEVLERVEAALKEATARKTF
jgi:hypothetical protein